MEGRVGRLHPGPTGFVSFARDATPLARVVVVSQWRARRSLSIARRQRARSHTCQRASARVPDQRDPQRSLRGQLTLGRLRGDVAASSARTGTGKLAPRTGTIPAEPSRPPGHNAKAFEAHVWLTRFGPNVCAGAAGPAGRARLLIPFAATCASESRPSHEVGSRGGQGRRAPIQRLR